MSENPAQSRGCLKSLALLEKRKWRAQIGGYIGLNPSKGSFWECYWLKTSIPAVLMYIWAHSCKYV